MFFDGSKPAMALRKARAIGTLAISDEVQIEYLIVFAREKFEKYVPYSFRMSFIDNIITNAIFVPISLTITTCRDPKDDKFLTVAFNASATCIISGDKDLLVLHPFRNIPVVSPADFVNF